MFGHDGSSEIEEVVQGLVELAGTGAALDASGLADDELASAVLALERVRRYLDAAQCHLLAELHDRKVTDRLSGSATSAWLAHEAKLPTHVARRRLVLANRLRELPVVDEYLSAGRIGFEHARVLTGATNPRNAAAMARRCAEFCDRAANTAFGRWRNETTSFAREQDPDGSHDPAGDEARNTLTLSPTDDLVLLRGEFTGEHAALIEHGLHQMTDELYRAHQRDRHLSAELPIPTRSTLRALALAELVRRGLAAGEGHSAARTEATLTLHTNHHHCCCETGHPHQPHEPDTGPHEPAGAGSTQRLGLHLPDRFRPHPPAWHPHPAHPPDPGPRHDPPGGDPPPGHPGPPGWDPAVPWWTLTDHHGNTLPTPLAQRHLCDPTIAALLTDPDGNPLHAGRTRRLITPTQRRALIHRDGGCTHPGCTTAPTWLDAHHLHHWTHGGPTDLDNLVLTCRRHHRLAHRTDWTLELTPDGWTRWTTPNGTTYWGQRHHHQRSTPSTP